MDRFDKLRDELGRIEQRHNELKQRIEKQRVIHQAELQRINRMYQNNQQWLPRSAKRRSDVVLTVGQETSEYRRYVADERGF